MCGCFCFGRILALFNKVLKHLGHVERFKKLGGREMKWTWRQEEGKEEEEEEERSRKQGARERRARRRGVKENLWLTLLVDLELNFFTKSLFCRNDRQAIY